jgi:hypothetical protein
MLKLKPLSKNKRLFYAYFLSINFINAALAFACARDCPDRESSAVWSARRCVSPTRSRPHSGRRWGDFIV